MSLRLLHRRLAVFMALSGLLGFASGAGFSPLRTIGASAVLALALFWQPSAERSARLERVWLPVALALVIRALLHVFVVRDDVVIPVVDLLLLLLAAEALRPLDAPNDIRLYALSFALVLASTAYRPGVVFLLSFVSYLGLTVLALLVGHLKRSAERHGVRDIPLGREVVRVTALLSVVVLVVAALVFLTFPRISRGWAARASAPAASIAGFADEVSIGEHGSTILENPRIVLRVEFPAGAPAAPEGLRWRGRSYDLFDGVRWSRSQGLPPSAPPVEWYRTRWGSEVIEQRIFGTEMDARVLFALHPLVDVDARDGIQPLFDPAGDFLYWGAGAPSYTALAHPPPSPAELRAAPDAYRPSDRHFLQLPELDPQVRALADSLTAGLTTTYDKALAIERWLQGFSYTRELPASEAETSLEHFLFRRRAGHCEYFSTAMVVLLRSVGIHARNVNGFLGGEWNEFGGYLVVTQNAAHSWVEVWFPGFGWVEFDPTPAGSGTGSASAAWFWPGRILFDGLQHRWGKWVLDYGPESQIDLLTRWSGNDARLERTRAPSPSGEGGVRRSVGIAVVALLVAAVLAALRMAAARPSQSPATRMYLELRRSAAGAGVRVTPATTPRALVDQVRIEAPTAAGACERLVGLYQEARYGGRPFGEHEFAAMREALRMARKSLRSGV